MESSKRSYIQILKSTTLLGGVQALNLVIGVLRTKISAIFIGVDGIGLVALFNSIVDLLRPIFNLGLNTSAVKEISHSANTTHAQQLSKTIQATFLLLIILGGIGATFLLLFAELFCQKTFGSLEYLFEVRCLSSLLITTAIFNGYLILFQGLRRIKLLAFCNAGSGLLGLIVMIPIYYYWGTDGIAPYLVLNGLIMALFVIIAGRKIRAFEARRITIKELWQNGNTMLRMGLLLTVNALFGAAVQYYLRQHLLTVGGLEVVGLFAASITILEGYGGILFTAMSGDFYPRLSAIHNDKEEMKELLRHQIEVGILFSSLLIIFLIAFSPLVISVLFSSKFMALTPMLVWGAIALVIKAIYIPLDYILIVKEEYRWVMFMEVLSMLYLACGVVGGYHYGGLEGIGIGYLITAILNWIQIQILLRYKYKMKLLYTLSALIVVELIGLTGLLIMVVCGGHNWITYTIGGIVLSIQLYFSICILQKKSGVVWQNLFRRK